MQLKMKKSGMFAIIPMAILLLFMAISVAPVLADSDYTDTADIEAVDSPVLLGAGNDFEDFEPFVTMAFVPVTDISDIPTETTAGTSLELSGTVTPSDASNIVITWSVKDDGGTGATIDGNTLSTTRSGTVTVEATIVDGTDIGTPFVKEFTITVTEDGGSGTSIWLWIDMAVVAVILCAAGVVFFIRKNP